MVAISDLIEINDNVRKQFLKKWNLSEEEVRKRVNDIIEYFDGQPFLPKLKLDARHVESILIQMRGCVEGVKHSIINYHFLKVAVPEMFLNRDPKLKEIRQVKEGLAFGIQYRVDDSGCRYVIVEFQDRPELFDVIAYYRFAFMLFDIKMRCDYSSDICLIVDMRKFSKEHMKKIPLDILRKVHYALAEAYGIVIKSVHFVIAPDFSDPLINNFRSVLKKDVEVKKHGDLESLYRSLERKLLPKNLGGEQKNVLEIWDLWMDKALEWRDWFLEEDNKYKV